MATFREAREALLLAYQDGSIDDTEFALLYDLNSSENLDSMTDDESKAEFWFFQERYLFILKMKQQQHDINFEEDSEKNSESQMGFEPTTLRDLVGCSNHLSYWRLYGEQGPICGSRLEPHHAATQPSNDWHTRTH